MVVGAHISALFEVVWHFVECGVVNSRPKLGILGSILIYETRPFICAQHLGETRTATAQIVYKRTSYRFSSLTLPTASEGGNALFLQRPFWFYPASSVRWKAEAGWYGL